MLRFNPVTGEVDLAPVFSQRPGPAGEAGAPGLQGEPGANGKDGKDGRDGRPGRDGVAGQNGYDGRDGNTLLNGPGAPSPAVGNHGDFYMDIASWTIYGPKNHTSWPEGVCLRGPQGIPGTNGNDGADGKDGKDGRDGVDGKDGRDGKNGERGLQGPPGSAPTGAFKLVPADYNVATHKPISVSIST